ncbi:unnamed protein product [Linum trigynum]|uniref:Uncharacterized protein n=1 Tax=Linum trigynum TaxID=586398 RepID=A0AAV2CTA7_9ROSI
MTTRLEELTDPPDGKVLIHAMTGGSNAATFHLITTIKEETAMHRIDGYSSHNFMNGKATRKLSLSATPISPFRVKTANGESLICTRCYASVPVEAQEMRWKVDFFELPIQGIARDTRWNRQVIFYWELSSMCIWYQEEWVGLQVIMGRMKPMITSPRSGPKSQRPKASPKLHFRLL